MKDGPKVGVLGAGAVGLYVGGRLAACGADVLFVGRPAVGAALRAAGLALGDVEGGSVTLAPERIAFATEPGALADRDAVLVCVKSGQTSDAAGALARALRPGSVVVSLQNGVRNPGRLRERLGGHTVLGGIVGFNVVWKGDAALHRAIGGTLVIEASSDPVARALVARLRDAGFEVATPADVAPLQWSKLLVNLNNAVSALSGAPTRELLLSPGYRRILAELVAEALGILRRAGIRPARFGTPIPVGLLPRLLRLPSPLFDVVARGAIKIDPEARSSMWDDLRRRRTTEVDELNGEIVRLAASLGLDAPRNRRIAELVHEAERRAAGAGDMSAEALARALRP